MRVYLPATVPLLSTWYAAGAAGPAPFTAFAVTPALREWYAAGDRDELEYAALTAAAQGSLRLLDLDPAALPRRVVVAADVADTAVTALPDLDRAAVRLAGDVPRARWAAVHLDDDTAAGTVAAAVAVVLEADLGSADAQFAVDEAEGNELLWYGVQELPSLLAELGA